MLTQWFSIYNLLAQKCCIVWYHESYVFLVFFNLIIVLLFIYQASAFWNIGTSRIKFQSPNLHAIYALVLYVLISLLLSRLTCLVLFVLLRYMIIIHYVLLWSRMSRASFLRCSHASRSLYLRCSCASSASCPLSSSTPHTLLILVI